MKTNARQIKTNERRETPSRTDPLTRLPTK